MEAGDGHSRVSVLLASDIARSLSIIYRKSWQAGEDTDDCKKVNVVHIFKIEATRRIQGTVGKTD